MKIEYFNTGCWIDGCFDFLRWNDHLVISDLHLGDGGDSDEFKRGGQEHRLTDLLHEEPNHSVIILGDLFGLIEFWLKDIEAYWGDRLIPLIFLKMWRWIVGNHDARALGFLDAQYRGVPIHDMLILGDTLFLHGHQDDPVAKHEKSIGALVTSINSWIVRQTGPEIGALSRQVETLISGGRDGEKTTYAEYGLDRIKNFWADYTRITKVYYGHTHRIDYQTRDTSAIYNDAEVA